VPRYDPGTGRSPDRCAVDRAVTFSLEMLMVSDGGIVVRGERRGSVHLLVPVGELDVATVAVLDRAFQAVYGDDDVAMIVVDLTELSFMDSTGIGLLVRMNDACEDADRLRVINGSASVVKLLDITGVR